LAPSEASSWPQSSLFQWINFKWVQNFTIIGSGTVDGQGYNWWSSSEFYDMQVELPEEKNQVYVTKLSEFSNTISSLCIYDQFLQKKTYSKHIPSIKPTVRFSLTV